MSRFTGAHPVQVTTGWTPSSPCGPGCHPVDDGPGAPLPRVAARLAGQMVVLLVTVLGTPLLAPAARHRWLRACCCAALRTAGVRLRVTGELGDGGALLVANHLSWIDVLAIGAMQPVRMLAKREVRDWPLIGALAARTGALFVDRAGLRALPATVAATAEALRCGAVVGVFPRARHGAAQRPVRSGARRSRPRSTRTRRCGRWRSSCGFPTAPRRGRRRSSVT